MLNLPNFLTLIRIVAIPFFLVLLSSELYLEALIVFVVSGLTDALDGAVARMMRQQTALGSYLDPVADKLLVMSSFVMLGFIQAVPPWLVVLVVSRDIIILLGYGVIYFMVEERLVVQPSFIGKLNTVFQLVTVGVVLLFLHDPRLAVAWLDDLLIYVTALTTVVSGFHYVYRALVWLQNRAPSPNRPS
ncbi:MAG: CDP-diacylglycerol--glycerol-3-phosphate 3-phosphatidyltransferase [Deltaproteobacteria bacterium]|nr:CDP-diacylglycerol--glycerol-3-phosphate 3-phosphatidyltransferase [Deltaproteobacteria bacterium]MBI3062074.1 CDP-diacylglycerol--glycerol-3-phosphate 3-phosphatidyltransferase [Deltaproteobacteria bacterium]